MNDAGETSILLLFVLVLTASGCTLGSHDLSSLRPTLLDIPVIFNGFVTPAVWAIDLCSNSFNINPNGTTPCFKGGYVVEYNSQTCATEPFDVLAKTLVENATFGTFLYGRATNPGWSATVEVSCGSTLELQPSGPVKAVGNIDLRNFIVSLSTSLMC